ncbi:hypothetical protein Btru_035291 [Bulinus truncatus]|nr:hypothetical protein Btru_035291 [Bulinus truncatus]
MAIRTVIVCIILHSESERGMAIMTVIVCIIVHSESERGMAIMTVIVCIIVHSESERGMAIRTVIVLERRDIERKEKVSLLISHVIDSDTGKVLSHCGPQEIKFETWSKSSPSGKLKAVIKQLKDKKNEDRQYLEIYDNNRKLKSFDLFAMEKHGKIIENDVNLEVEWSQSESHLLYIAEKKKTKSGSFFSAKGFQDKSSDEQIQIMTITLETKPSFKSP